MNVMALKDYEFRSHRDRGWFLIFRGVVVACNSTRAVVECNLPMHMFSFSRGKVYTGGNNTDLCRSHPILSICS